MNAVQSVVGRRRLSQAELDMIVTAHEKFVTGKQGGKRQHKKVYRENFHNYFALAVLKPKRVANIRIKIKLERQPAGDKKVYYKLFCLCRPVSAYKLRCSFSDHDDRRIWIT